MADDLALLRAFEPVVRFTEGEYFFPVSVERYVQQATLWADPEHGAGDVRAPAGTLSLADLGSRSTTTQGLGESLSGIVDGESKDHATIPAKDRPPRLKGGSRLASVGLLARLIDALNRVSLLFRGSVPGGSAARSYLLQRDHLAPEEPTYYGRVIHEGDWVICQYWFFYAFNNWRSAFGGVNEHEADWEQVTVYLDGTGEGEQDGWPAPRWVVFSAHDETGDDLRRRWDDPDLTVVGGRHPVVFSGAGSHSGAYLAGDYLITVPAPTLGGFVKAVRWIARALTPWSPEGSTGLGIPYVDYARGDGRTIGPGGDDWRAVQIDRETPWVRDYRGLWGHDTRDRLGGERGPAGPRYERNGAVRESWADPLGWAGMAKVAPNAAIATRLMAARADQLGRRTDELRIEIATARTRLETAAAGLAPSAPEVRALGEEEERVLAMRMELAGLDDDRDRILDQLAADSMAEPDPHAHLRHRRTPLVALRGLRSRALAGWAVVSGPVILWAVGEIIRPTEGVSFTYTLMGWIVVLLSIEGLLRGKFLAAMSRLVSVVVIVVVLYYAVADWRLVIGWGFAGAALLLLVVNLRDAFKR